MIDKDGVGMTKSNLYSSSEKSSFKAASIFWGYSSVNVKTALALG